MLNQPFVFGQHQAVIQFCGKSKLLMFPGLEKKIWTRFIILASVTAPVFGLLGGVPFPALVNNEIRIFLPFIFFIAFVTLASWLMNALLLAGATRYALLKKPVIRATCSIVICVVFSAVSFNVFRSYNPPPVKFVFKEGRPPAQTVFYDGGLQVKNFQAADSVFKNNLPPQGKMIHRGFFPFPQLVHLLTINLIVLILCELVMLHFRQQKTEMENARLRQTSLEARNSQLRNQLHPHFLFNSLNTLRLLLKKDADKAESYLLKLSEILRASTTSAMNSITDVKDELNLCLSYLQMQELRFGDMLLYDVTNKKLQDAKGKLPVFALQLLAENAIKHNAFTSESPLHIFIDYDEERQLVTVRNKIKAKRLTEVTTQTGLRNLDERYRLLSGGHIIVNNTGDEFAVSIKII